MGSKSRLRLFRGVFGLRWVGTHPLGPRQPWGSRQTVMSFLWLPFPWDLCDPAWGCSGGVGGSLPQHPALAECPGSPPSCLDAKPEQRHPLNFSGVTIRACLARRFQPLLRHSSASGPWLLCLWVSSFPSLTPLDSSWLEEQCDVTLPLLSPDLLMV